MGSNISDLKIIYFGCTKFSSAVLKHLLDNGVTISAVFSIPKEFGISYSETKVKNFNFANLEPMCAEAGIPLQMVESSEGNSTLTYEALIRRIDPDVILVIGWYYMVPARIRELARLGAWGIHASLLPKYAGGAPLVWAIINGEKETGTTLFKLEQGVDDGDIIAQRKISIAKDDTIKEVYEKATEESRVILMESLLNVDKIKFKPQDKDTIEIWPQRSPEDGKIDWNWDEKSIWNFVRAQSKPYPGAYTVIDGKKISIWNKEDIKKYRPS